MIRSTPRLQTKRPLPPRLLRPCCGLKAATACGCCRTADATTGRRCLVAATAVLIEPLQQLGGAVTPRLEDAASHLVPRSLIKPACRRTVTYGSAGGRGRRRTRRFDLAAVVARRYDLRLKTPKTRVRTLPWASSPIDAFVPPTLPVLSFATEPLSESNGQREDAREDAASTLVVCTRSYARAGMPSKILVAKRNVSVHECAGDLKTTTVEMNTRMLQVVECRRALGPARFEPGPVSSSRSCLRQSQPRPEPPTDRTIWPIRRRSFVVKAQRVHSPVRLRVGPGVTLHAQEFF